MKTIVSTSLLSALGSAAKKFEAPITLETRKLSDSDLNFGGVQLLNLGEWTDDEDQGPSILATKDIENYFNLQITTKLYIGSENAPHDLILDTGSMVSFSIDRGMTNDYLYCSGPGCRPRTAGTAALIIILTQRPPQHGQISKKPTGE